MAEDALGADKTVQEIEAKHELHPNQGSTWKRQVIDGMAEVFSGDNLAALQAAGLRYANHLSAELRG